jgi:glycosyltransferase involved in cell wall biosynthesis
VGEVDVSIVIPCFNDGRFLGEAVASALACVDPRCEVIVVDDGSDEPATLEALDEVRGTAVTVLERPHRGPGAARNAGIEAASGRFILPLDADNRLRPRYAALGCELLDRDPGIAIVYGDAELFGERTGIRRPRAFELERLLRGNYIDTCAVFRREVWEQTGGYATAVISWEDWSFWLAAAEAGFGFHYVPEVLFEYRVRADGRSTPHGRADWRARRAAVVALHPELFRNGRRDLRGLVAGREPALYSLLSEHKQAVERWFTRRLRRHSPR